LVSYHTINFKEKIMSMLSRKVLSVVLLSTLVITATSSAFAQTEWQKEHPRRAQVNKRLHNQNQRINQEVKEGEITKAQAAKLHKEDRQIRQEERDMASQNGGHITKQEQKTLNQQENAVSRQIGK
jgi:cell division protein FtsB